MIRHRRKQIYPGIGTAAGTQQRRVKYVTNIDIKYYIAKLIRQSGQQLKASNVAQLQYFAQQIDIYIVYARQRL